MTIRDRIIIPYGNNYFSKCLLNRRLAREVMNEQIALHFSNNNVCFYISMSNGVLSLSKVFSFRYDMICIYNINSQI